MSSYYRILALPKLLTETQAIINRAVLEGFTLPSNAIIKSIDTLILSMKTSGFWDKQDYILNFSYNNALLTNFSRINWKNPSFALATLNGGLTYTINGFEGNGTNAYIDTNFQIGTNTVNYTLNNASFGGVIYKEGTSTVNFLNSGNNSPIDGLRNGNFDTQRINSSNNLNTGANMTGIGFKHLNRLDSANIRLYNKEVILDRTQTVRASLTVNNQNLFRGFGFYSNLGASFYCIGASITDIQANNFRTNYNNYLTSIGLTPIT